MPKNLVEIASEIVQTQVAVTQMSAADIASSLRQVFVTLQEINKAETGGIDLPMTAEGIEVEYQEAKLSLTPEDSIQKDKVICLECGAEMKQLTATHLFSHSMTPKEYKKKYGFTMQTPLVAKSLIKARSKAGKKRGLPENLLKFQEARRQAQAEVKKPSELSGPGAERVKKVRRRFSPKKME